MTRLIFALIFYSLFLNANPLTAKNLWKKHCQDVELDSSLFINNLKKPENKLSFTNYGGLLNGGVCWWHSRFTRAAQYLAVFEPAGNKLSQEEAYYLAKRIREGRPVTIRGYKNLNEFSMAHQREIQQNLEEWQVYNGGFQLGFLDGLMGATSVSSKQLQEQMDELYNDFKISQKPIYQVLQLPGITAHAWLIVDMIPMATGYQFEVVDSNYLKNQIWRYQYGSTSFFYGQYPFVNYTTRRGKIEEAALAKRLAKACKSLESKGLLFEATLDIDQEIDLELAASGQ